MKTNKISIVLFIFLCGIVLHINGQTKSSSGVIVIPIRTIVHNDSLYVEMDIDVDRVKIKSQEALILTPVIRSSQQAEELPSVFLGGKKRYKAYLRQQAFGTARFDFFPLQARKDETSIIHYACVLPYQNWMEKAGLNLKEEIYGCADCQRSVSWLPLDAKISQPLQELPLILYINPPVEITKNRDIHGKAYLDFPVNQSVILPNFRNNQYELNKIHQAIAQVKANKYATATSIDLIGYASPEGNEALNETLSMNRSLSLKNYLQHTYDYPNSFFSVNWQGEDWQGLEQLITPSSLKNKQMVLDVITSRLPDKTKDLQMKSVDNGILYPILLQDYYPLLRRVEYCLNYTLRSFTLAESIEIAKTDPSQLSLNELYLVAQEYPKGSKAFHQIWDIAVSNYPLDPIANLNAGAAALETGNLVKAHRYLDKYKTLPQAWNNIAVMYLMEGRPQEAEKYLLLLSPKTH